MNIFLFFLFVFSFCANSKSDQRLHTKRGKPLRKFKYNHEFRKKHETLKKFVSNEIVSEETSDPSLIPVGYKTIEEINEEIWNFENEFPNNVHVFDLTNDYGNSLTHLGKSIFGLEIIEGPQRNKKQNVLIVCGTHAREIVSPEMCFGIMDHLLTETPHYLDTYNFYFIPVFNVDGYEKVFTENRWWRKNAREIEVSRCAGVDLNRNFDINWEGWCGGGGRSRECEETYAGPSAFSEPETIALSGLIHMKKPSKVLDFHSRGRQVLYGYPGGSYQCDMNHPFQEYLHDFASQLASVVGSNINFQEEGQEEFEYASRTPHAAGEEELYAMKVSTNFAFLVETELEFQPSYESALFEVQAVLPLFDEWVEEKIPIEGFIVHSETGEGLDEVKIEIEGIEFEYGENRKTDERGIFHLFVPNVNPNAEELGICESCWNISFQKEGFEERVITFDVLSVDNNNNDEEEEELPEFELRRIMNRRKKKNSKKRTTKTSEKRSNKKRVSRKEFK